MERLVRDDVASQLWREAYGHLNEERQGVYSKTTSRAVPQVLRLSTIYALMSGSPIIRRTDLTAALAVWDCCDVSARCIFGDSPDDPLAAKVLDHLRAASSAGMTRTELRDAFGRHLKSSALLAILAKLRDRRVVERLPPEPTAGRSRERWRVQYDRATEATEGVDPP